MIARNATASLPCDQLRLDPCRSRIKLCTVMLSQRQHANADDMRDPQLRKAEMRMRMIYRAASMPSITSLTPSAPTTIPAARSIQRFARR